MESEHIFYMIHVDGHGSPTKKHFSSETALAEARRLAKINLNKNVYILTPVKLVKQPLAEMQEQNL